MHSNVPVIKTSGDNHQKWDKPTQIGHETTQTRFLIQPGSRLFFGNGWFSSKNNAEWNVETLQMGFDREEKIYPLVN